MKGIRPAILTMVILFGGTSEISALEWDECLEPNKDEIRPEIIISACTKFIQSDDVDWSDKAIAYFRRSRGFHELEQLNRAIADLNSAIELEPDYWRAYRNRGLAYLSAGNARKAAEDINWAAINGDVSAQNRLAVMYHRGQGVEQNYSEAMKWYRMAAAQGYGRAQTSVGYMYEKGQGVPQDFSEALKWYRLAAEQGDPYAQTSVGFMYASGEGVPQDLEEAYYWFFLAAVQGNESARQSKDAVAAANLLTPDQIAEVERMAREWMAEHRQ